MAVTEYFRIIKERSRRPAFNSLFLFVTSRCNSLCRTCFYFDKLNRAGDLTLDQIRRISETAPPFRKLWFSGGEPTLREELGEIAGLFAANNGVRNVNLPTNGILEEKVFRAVDAMLERTGEDVAVDLNFSLDGLANTHDAIRGVPNNFERTVATMQAAEKRYAAVKRLRVNVVSVVTRENYGELMRLGFWIARNVNADGHYFEIVRGEMPDGTLKSMTRGDVASLHRRLMPLHRMYARKLFAHLPPGARQLAAIYYLGNLRLHYELHERCFGAPEAWPMRCTAGETTLVVDHNGRFRACELRDPVGGLADYGYDAAKALASEPMKREIEAIGRDGCWCTHSCFIHESSKFSPRVQLFEIPWAWWKQRMEGGGEASAEEMEQFRSLNLA